MSGAGPTAVVDFGSSHVVTVLHPPGRAPRLVTVDGEPWMSSAVFLSRDDQLVVGQDALRMAAAEPARLATAVTARLDERELLLGDTVLPMTTVVRAVLSRVVLAATGLAGGPVEHLVLTHPAAWGPDRLGVLLAAARGLAPHVGTVPGPLGVAARAELPDGGLLGVVDLGGGTCDVAVVRRGPAGLEIVGHATIPDLGGADLDQRIVDHLVATVPGLSDVVGDGDGDLARLRELAAFRQEVRRAKELLSRHLQVDVALPGGLPDVRLTRGELESIIYPDLDRIAAFTLRAILSHVEVRQLRAVRLVGGSARIPLLGQLLSDVLSAPIQVDDQPEAVVALGAATLVAPGDRRPAPAAVARPSRRPALVVLVLVVLLAAGLAGYGLLAPPDPVAGAATVTAERFTLPAPEPGAELATAGSATDGLVTGQAGVPTRLFDGVTDVDWTVRAVTDPADDVVTVPAPEGYRWVLAELSVRARAPAAAPYYLEDTYLVDDRGLLIAPIRDAPLPARCAAAAPPVLETGAEAVRCLAFLVSSRTPVRGVVVSRPDAALGQLGVRVPVDGAAAAGGPVAGVPAGAVRPLRFGGALLRAAVVDAVTEADAYVVPESLRRPGQRAVVVRAVVSGEPVPVPDLVAGLVLRDDRDQPAAPLGAVSVHECAPPDPGAERVVVCAAFAVPVGVAPHSVAWIGDAGVPTVWELP